MTETTGTKGTKVTKATTALVPFSAFFALVPVFALFAFLAGTDTCRSGNFNDSAIGTTSAQFLKLAVGARGVALGEAYSALVDDASSLYWNPAGLVRIKSRSVMLMHAFYFGSTSFNYMAYSQKEGDLGVWGLSIQHMDSGSIPQTDISGTDIGSFNPRDIAVSLGFACDISGFRKEPEERFTLGATGKIIHSRIMANDTTITADIGLLFPYFFENRFQLALVAQNIMGSLKFDQESCPMPFILRLGTRTKMNRRWDITADLAVPVDNYPYFAMGTEVRIQFFKSLNASLRAGVNTRAVSDIEGLRNITLGMGLGSGILSIDYAFAPFGILGNAHRISLGLDF